MHEAAKKVFNLRRAGSFDATVRIWDCKSQSTKPIQELEESGDSVSSLDVLGHEIVTGSVDGIMRLYDLRMGKIYADVLGRKKKTPPNPKTPCPKPTIFFFPFFFLPHSLPPESSPLTPFPRALEPITSIHQTRDGNAVLASTLDSTIRLMDKSNGKLLQSYKTHINKDYRIRSTLAFADSVVIAGSEDGRIYAWDLLTGDVIAKLGDDDDGGARPHGGKVASAVACHPARREWASGGVDGEFFFSSPLHGGVACEKWVYTKACFFFFVGTVVIWGLPT